MATPTYEQLLAKQAQILAQSQKQGFSTSAAKSLANNWLTGAMKQYGVTPDMGGGGGKPAGATGPGEATGFGGTLWYRQNGYVQGSDGLWYPTSATSSTVSGIEGQQTPAASAPASGSSAAGGGGVSPLDQAQADYYKTLADKAKETPEKVTQQVMRPSYATSLGSQLASKYASGLNSYTPGQAYTGNLSTQATTQEKTGLNLLDQYLSGGKSELSTAAEGQALKTLGGEYTDVATNPYVQSLRTLSNRNLTENLDTLNRQRGAAGKYFTSETIAQGNKATTNAQQNLDAQVAQIIDTERGRQTGMVGTASALSTAADNAAQNKVAASQTYGNLQRTIEANNLENAYKAWLNQRSEQGSALGQAGQIATDNPQYGLMSWYA